VIPIHNEFIPIKHGRAAFAVSVEGLHFAEVLLPENGAF
jgi:hypothetical protein